MTAPSNAVEIRVLLRMCCINSRKKSPPSAKRALHPQKEPYLSFNRALHPQKEPCISAKRAIYNRTQQRDQDQSPAAHVLRLLPQPQPAPRVVLHVYVCVCRRVHICAGACGWACVICVYEFVCYSKGVESIASVAAACATRTAARVYMCM